MKKLYLFGWLMLFCLTARAQSFSFSFDTTAQVSVNNKVLPNAWAGGLNAPQFSKMYLNADTLEDLVVLDRTAAKIFTFLATRQPDGTYGWTYEPTYQAYFPAIDSWMLLRDYDKDGRKDLFARTPAGIKVFHNIANSAGGFSWVQVANPLYTEGFSGQVNMQVPATDIPGIADVDGDGDLDIVIFDSSGNFAEYHQNMSMENTGSPGLVFQKIGYCWGNFTKELYDDACFNVDCDTGVSDCPAKTNSISSGGRTLHAGNSMLLWDYNGDGLTDLFYSYVLATNVAYLPNAGTKTKATFTQANYLFPTTQPIDIHVFPAIFSEDVTFDGKPDLLAAPNVYANDETKLNDFRESIWLYENTGTTALPDLTYRQKNFLQEDMVDLGENTTTALADIDGDGDADLLVGYAGIRSDSDYRGGIALFRNNGTPQKASFTLETTDYQDISSTLLSTEGSLVINFRIFLTDITGDSVADLGFAAENAAGTTIIRYIPNRGSKGSAFQLNVSELTSLPLPTGFDASDNITFYDLDSDGKVDALVSTYYGGLEFHRNTGTNAAPAYTLSTDSYGGLANNYQNYGSAVLIADVNGDEKPELLTAYSDGSMKIFDDFLHQSSTGFVSDTALIQQPADYITKLQLSSNPSLGAADLDDDGLPDLVIGTNTGGLLLLKNESEKRTPDANTEALLIYPNPTNQHLTVQTQSAATVRLYTLTGQSLGNAKAINSTEYYFDVSSLPGGLYVVRVESTSLGRVSRNIVIYR
ncbi:MAG: FG-GAP-like repeat-containing protein [Siphonobacter sp.]